MLVRTGLILGLILGSATAGLYSAQVRSSGRDQAYVVGYVVTPMAIDLDHPMTLAQALAKAGGPLKAHRIDKVFIYRLLAKGHMTTCISIKEIDRGRLADFQLLANDILEVTSGKCGRPMCWSVNHEPAVNRVIR